MMSIPLEIAAAMKAGLRTALSSVIENRTTVYADGVSDTDNAAGDQVVMPLVMVTVSECSPNQYRSVLRSFPVSIDVNTWYQDDRDQTDLYAIAAAVSAYLCTPPSLTLTSATFDAFYFDAAPERGNDEAGQFMRWTGTANLRVTT